MNESRVGPSTLLKCQLTRLRYSHRSPTEGGPFRIVTDLLAQAYERFMTDGDMSSFERAIEQHGGIAPPSELECPIAHRIRDVLVCEQWYRVVRVYDPDNRSCRVFIYPTETPGEQSGVPYELSGESLHQWVMDELEEPTDGNTDWSKYLGTMSN